MRAAGLMSTPNAAEARRYAGQAIRKLPAPLRTAFEREGGWRVEYSLELQRVLDQVRERKGMHA